MIYFEPCEETLKRFNNDSVDLIVTSPPYYIGKMHSNRTIHGTYTNNDMDEVEYQKWQIKVLDECYRVLSNDGSMFYMTERKTHSSLFQRGWDVSDKL